MRCWWAPSLKWLVEKSAKQQQGIFLLTSLRAFLLSFLLHPRNRTEDFWWRDNESETSVRDMMYLGLRDFIFLNCGSLRHYSTEVWHGVVELSVLHFSWTLKIELNSSGGRKMSLRLLSETWSVHGWGISSPSVLMVSKTLQKSEKALQNCTLTLETMHVWLSCAS